jgi:hypothetical protein
MQAAHVAATPDGIFQTALGFMASKVLLSAVEVGVFGELAKGPREAEALGRELGLHPRGTRDFLDTLVALGLLCRENGFYSNTTPAAEFLDPAQPGYIGGVIQMANARLYGFWGSLTEALRTGRPQNEAKNGGDLFESVYHSPESLRGFLSAMTGLSVHAGRAIAAKFPWDGYRTFCDVGCAQGAVPVQVALAHPRLEGYGFDLAKVGPVFKEYVGGFGLNGRVRFRAGDFFRDPLPETDVLIMGHILHDWDLDAKMLLLEKAYAALPAGGALIVHEAMIDDERRQNVGGLLMSLNMLIETPGGFDYTGADCMAWAREAGFRSARIEPLTGADSMMVAIK